MTPNLILYNDASLPLGKEAKAADVFELENRLQPIYEAILSKDTPTPFTIMFSGGWGTGKTSAMRWMEQHLRDRGNGKNDVLNVDTCWFYPWKYQSREDVWKGLIAEVIVASIDFEKVDTAKVIMAAKQFGRFLGGSFVRVLSALKFKTKAGELGEAELAVKDALSGIIEEYGKHVTPQDAYYNVFEKSLEDWIRQTYKKDKSRLVIFIDDLDRCLPAVALQVLEAMKLYLNIPNIVVVVGVDRQVIDAVVVKHYRDNLDSAVEELGPKARQYLDKMFQVEVPISPHDIQVKKFIQEKLRATTLWRRMDVANQGIFEGVIGEIADINPRNVLRALNTAIVGAGSSEDPLVVAQNVQLALVKTVLQRLPESTYGVVHDLCLRAEGRSFFAKWSQAVLSAPSAPSYLLPEELALVVARGADQLTPQDLAPSNARNSKTVQDTNIDHLLTVAREFPLVQELMILRALGLLMRLPFPEDGTPLALNASQDALDMLKRIVAENHRIGFDQVTDDYLNELTNLDLQVSEVDPNVLLPLVAQLPNLEGLSLNNTPATDIGLESVKGLTQLQELYLNNTHVTDIGLESVKGLTQLQWLSLDNTHVTDTGLESVKGLTQLEVLSLDNTQVTDKGLESVKGLTQLRWLYLDSTQVTDKGLESVKGLTQLQWLYLANTLVTNKGLAELRNALPHCRVYPSAE